MNRKQFLKGSFITSLAAALGIEIARETNWTFPSTKSKGDIPIPKHVQAVYLIQDSNYVTIGKAPINTFPRFDNLGLAIAHWGCIVT